MEALLSRGVKKEKPLFSLFMHNVRFCDESDVCFAGAANFYEFQLPVMILLLRNILSRHSALSFPMGNI